MNGASDQSGLLVAGWVMLLVLPPGAVVVGFATAERHLAQGLTLCVLGVWATLAWIYLAANVTAGLAL